METDEKLYYWQDLFDMGVLPNRKTARQTIENRYKRDAEFRDKYCRMNGKRIGLTEEGVEFLKSQKIEARVSKPEGITININVPNAVASDSNKVKPAEEKTVKEVSASEPVIAKEEPESTPASNEKLDEFFRTQLAEKDEQIRELQQTVKAQMILLGQSEVKLSRKEDECNVYRTAYDKARNMGTFFRKRKAREIDEEKNEALKEIASSMSKKFDDNKLIQSVYTEKVAHSVDEVKMLNEPVEEEPETLEVVTESVAQKAETTALNDKVCVS